jgi:hypothetical protein
VNRRARIFVEAWSARAADLAAGEIGFRGGSRLVSELIKQKKTIAVRSAD